MKKLLKGMRCLAILLIISMQLNAQTNKKLQAIFGVNAFAVSGKSPYLETYLLVKGSTIQRETTNDGQFKGQVEVKISISENDKIVYADRYTVNSPQVADSTHIIPNFIDQQRISVPNGKYVLELEIKDLLSDNKPLKTSTDVEVNFSEELVSISDINLVESIAKANQTGPLTKSGMDLMPHISSFYAPDDNRLIFYSEIYNTQNILGNDEKFVVSFHIEDSNTEKINPNFSGFKRFTSAPVNVILHEFEIANLPTGNYHLVIAAKNRDNEVIASKKCFFQKSNPGLSISFNDLASINTENSFVDSYMSMDTLAEYIRCLRPISTPVEQQFGDNQLKVADIKLMQQFFYGFWYNRNSTDPEKEWHLYKEEVKKVNKEFSTLIKRGYMTDRGRVYLQYGPPDSRAEAPREPSAFPYEVWHYYKLKNQNNRRFVFYNPDLITNDYELIHSTANGEVFDERWHLRILRRDTQTHDLDREDGYDHYGTRVKDLYLMPR
jgi:GWxTD domain-containing protein